MHHTLVGASVPVGVQALREFSALKLGECVLTILPEEKSEALAVARYCRDHRLTLYFAELLCRGSLESGPHGVVPVRRRGIAAYSKADIGEVIDAAGEYYGGRMTIGEAGGLLYWPKSYVLGRCVGEFACIPPVRTMDQAKEEYIKYLKVFIDYERRTIGKGPLLDVDSALVFKYHAQAGIDVLCLESMPGDPHLMHAAIRGAAKAYGKPWGTHIAMACYGGVHFDELWLKRWKTALYHAYISGAHFVWPECGYYDYDQRQGQKFPFHSAEMKHSRRILRECYQFSRVHTRPGAGPSVTLGVVYGNLDGAPGLWNRYAWGQFKGKKWLEGPAERGWRLVDKFHCKEDWPNRNVQGKRDFSGNPPYGQYDVVPIEAPLSVLKSYRCLVFLSWNTMTDAIYQKLKRYVRGGGHLLMNLPHLSTGTDRAKAVKLHRGGDFRDLFGVRILGKGKKDVRGMKCLAHSSLPEYRFPLWRLNADPHFLGEFTPSRLQLAGARVISGYDDFYRITPEQLSLQPILTEHTLGRGKAFLVSAWEYPADEGLLPFTADIIRTVLAGEQGDIRLLGSDRVRYAVYQGSHPATRRKVTVVYLLNTDPDCESTARLQINGRLTGAFEIPANQLRLAYVLQGIVLLPESPLVDLKSWTPHRGGSRINFFSARAQGIEVHNVGRAAQRVSLNGSSGSLEPGECRTLRVRRAVDAARREFFDPDFLEEPVIRPSSTKLPY